VTVIIYSESGSAPLLDFSYNPTLDIRYSQKTMKKELKNELFEMSEDERIRTVKQN
jgi:hypothetical protein